MTRTSRREYGIAPPSAGETQAQFMDRCVPACMTAGESEAEAMSTCTMMWNGEGEDAAPPLRTKGAVERAYSTLQIKSFGEETRTIEGMASTPSVDRVGDVVVPTGAKFKLPMPLLWQHRHDSPVGHVEFAEATEKGIPFRARIAKVDEPGDLKNMVDRAWQSVKHKLVGAVSIGFKIRDHEPLDKKDPFGGWLIKEWEWLELSLVTIPANQDCTIGAIRSAVQSELAASGRTKTPARVGASKVIARPAKEAKSMAKKSIAEQISAFEATLNAKQIRMQELMDAAAEKGETLNEGETEEYDTLADEIKQVSSHLTRLRDLEKLNAQKAAPIVGTTPEDAGKSRATVPVVVQAKRTVPPEIPFVRYVKALAYAKGNRSDAIAYAQAQQDWVNNTPEVIDALKTAVAPGTSTHATWGGPLVYAENLAAAFIDFLRPQTILGRVPGLRRVPFNIRVPRMTTGAVAAWVGEASAKPLTSLAFDSVTLGYTKIAGIIPLSEELVRFSSPSAEGIVRDDLARAVIQLMDRDFIDPTKTAVTGVSPASITNGVTPTAATGATAAALRTDVQTLFTAFLSNNLSMANAVWIMNANQAMSISLMLNALGNPLYPDINAAGGTFLGLPVVTSENVPEVGGSPANGSYIILVKADDILVADDGQVTIDASREASLQMDTAPDSPTTASTILVSLWQNNMIAIKAERFVNWVKGRTTAVALISYAKYTG